MSKDQPPDWATTERPKQVKRGDLCFHREFNPAIPDGDYPWRLRRARVQDVLRGGNSFQIAIIETGKILKVKGSHVLWPVERMTVADPRPLASDKPPEPTEPEPDEELDDEGAEELDAAASADEIDAWVAMGQSLIEKEARIVSAREHELELVHEQIANLRADATALGSEITRRKNRLKHLKEIAR